MGGRARLRAVTAAKVVRGLSCRAADDCGVDLERVVPVQVDELVGLVWFALHGLRRGVLVRVVAGQDLERLWVFADDACGDLSYSLSHPVGREDAKFAVGELFDQNG